LIGGFWLDDEQALGYDVDVEGRFKDAGNRKMGQYRLFFPKFFEKSV